MKKKQKMILAPVLLTTAFQGFVPQAVFAENANVQTKTFIFDKSMNIKQNHNVTIDDLGQIVDVWAEDGDVDYSRNYHELNFDLDNMSEPNVDVYNPQKYSKEVSTTQNSSSRNSLDSIYAYSSSDGYAGTIPATTSVSSYRVADGGYWRGTGYWRDVYETRTRTETRTRPKRIGWCLGSPGHRAPCTYAENYTTITIQEEYQVQVEYQVKVGQEWVSTGQEWVTTYSTRYRRTYGGTVYRGGNDGYYEYKVTVSYYPDVEKPTLTLDYDDSDWSDYVDVNLTTSDRESGVKTVTLPDGSTETSLNTTYRITENGDHTFSVVDNAGNETTETITIEKIDTKNPNEPTIDKTGEVHSPETVEVTITDNGDNGPSDVSHIEYRLTADGTTGEWQTYHSPLVFESTQKTTVDARVWDNNNNVSGVVSTNVHVDKTFPVLTLIKSATEFTNEDVILSVEATDNDDIVHITLPDGSTTLNTSLNYVITTNGDYTFKTIDRAGNETTEVVTINNIDKKNPETPTMEHTRPDGEWVDSNIDVTLVDNGDEGVSGSYLEYRFNDETTWRRYTGLFELATEGTTTVVARAKDNAGNVSPTVTKQFKIDKYAPIISITSDMEELLVPQVVLTATATDGISGVNFITLPDGSRVYDDEATFVVKLNGTYHFKAEDHTGNVSTYDFSVSNVKENILITNIRDVRLEMQAQDDLSSVEEMRFRNEYGSWSSFRAYSKWTTWRLSEGDGLKYVWASYKDSAGNISDPVHDVIILDTVPPTIEGIEINDGDDYTNKQQVEIDVFNVGDDLTDEEDLMLLVSNDNKTWTEMPYVDTFDWTLGNTEGINTVYVKVRDEAGNTTLATDTIFLDTRKPTAEIVINNGDGFTPTREVELTLTYADTGSGVAKVEVIEGESVYELPTPHPASPTTIEWLLDFGIKPEVTIRVTDEAGNVSTATDFIIVDKLTINAFTLENVINPLEFNDKAPFVPLTWAFEPQPMLAGGNITFSIDIKEAVEPSFVTDKADYFVEIVGEDYHRVFNGAMDKTNNHYSHTLMIPEDAPEGAKVYARVKAERDLLVSPYDKQIVYFPGDADVTQKALIGEVTGDINEVIRFNETK